MGTKHTASDGIDSGRIPKPLKCEACGRFIPWEDLEEGYAVRRLVYPDSQFTREEFETLCSRHK